MSDCQTRSHITTIWSIVLITQVLPSAVVCAADSPAGESDELFDMSLEELMEVPVVVSASRQAQPMDELAVPVTVITGEDIHYSGLTDIAELLQFAPGVDVLRVDRNRYAVGIRGLHEMYSDRVLTLIDGRLADDLTSGGPQFSRLPLLVEDIERIEIVRGPGGAAWGANAFTGVINIITKDPSDCRGWFGSTKFNHFGDSYSQIRWGDKAGKWRWRQSAGYEDFESSDDALHDDNFVSNDFARNWRFNGESIYQASDDTKATLGWGYSHQNTGDFEFGGRSLGKNGRNDLLRAFARLDHAFEEDVTGYLQVFSNYSNIKDPSLIEYTENENNLEGQINFKPAEDHEMSVGGNLRWIRIDGERTKDPQQFIYGGVPLSEYWAGAFLIDRWHTTDRLTLEGQLRTDWYSATETDWAGRFTALYGLDEAKDHILRLSWARAFRAPAISIRQGLARRIPHPLVPGAFLLNLIRPNKNLENESSYSLEAGYTGKLAPGLTLRVDGYYQRFENLIGFATVPDPLALGRTFFTTSNIDGADSWGAETELAIENKTSRFSLWYTYNDFETDRAGQPLRAYLPAQHKAGLTARWFLDDNWTINTNYRFASRTEGKHANPLNITSPGRSHRVDLTISRKLPQYNGELMFGVLDILNTDNDPVSAVGALTAHETPGRTYFLQARFRFK